MEANKTPPKLTKAYKLSWREWLQRATLVFWFLCGGVLLFFSATAFEVKTVCLFCLFWGGYIAWFTVKTAKNYVIRIDHKTITLPTFNWRGQYVGKTIPWEDVLGVITLAEYGVWETYIIPPLQAGGDRFEQIIRRAIKEGKENKVTKMCIAYLKRTAQAFKLPHNIRNYRLLLREICARATTAFIDDDTLRIMDFKGYLVPFKDFIKLIMKEIISLRRGLWKTKRQMYRFRRLKGRRPIVFLHKPFHPYLLVPISLPLFLLGGVLACRNYVLMGNSQRCITMAIAMLLAAGFTTTIYLFSPSHFINAFLWVNLIFGVGIGYLQFADYLQWRIRRLAKR